MTYRSRKGSVITFSIVDGGVNRNRPRTFNGSVSTEEYVTSSNATDGSRWSFSKLTNISTVHSGLDASIRLAPRTRPVPAMALMRRLPKVIEIEPIIRCFSAVVCETIRIPLYPSPHVFVWLFGSHPNAFPEQFKLHLVAVTA